MLVSRIYSLPIIGLVGNVTTHPFAQFLTPADRSIEIMGIRLKARNSTAHAACGIKGSIRSGASTIGSSGTTPVKLLPRDPATGLSIAATALAVGIGTASGAETANTIRHWNFNNAYGLEAGAFSPDEAALGRSLGILVEPSQYYCFQFTAVPPSSVSFDGEIVFRESLVGGRDYNVLLGTSADPVAVLNVAAGTAPWFKITAPATCGLVVRAIHLFQTADTTTARALLGLRHYTTEPTDAGTDAPIMPLDPNGPTALFAAKYDLNGFTGGSPAYDTRALIPFNLGAELVWPLSPADQPIAIAPSKSLFLTNEISADKNGYTGRVLVSEVN